MASVVDLLEKTQSHGLCAIDFESNASSRRAVGRVAAATVHSAIVLLVVDKLCYELWMM